MVLLAYAIYKAMHRLLNGLISCSGSADWMYNNGSAEPVWNVCAKLAVQENKQ